MMTHGQHGGVRDQVCILFVTSGMTESRLQILRPLEDLEAVHTIG